VSVHNDHEACLNVRRGCRSGLSADRSAEAGDGWRLSDLRCEYVAMLEAEAAKAA